MRKFLILLSALAMGLAVLVGVSSPAQAASWSPQVCKDYSQNGFKVCSRYYSSYNGTTRTVSQGEFCIYGTGPAGPTVQRAGENRAKIMGSGGAFLGQAYFADVSRGSCRTVALGSISGGNGMRGEWTGKMFASPGFDKLFDTCVQVSNGVPCIF